MSHIYLHMQLRKTQISYYQLGRSHINVFIVSSRGKWRRRDIISLTCEVVLTKIQPDEF